MRQIIFLIIIFSILVTLPVIGKTQAVCQPDTTQEGLCYLEAGGGSGIGVSGVGTGSATPIFCNPSVSCTVITSYPYAGEGQLVSTPSPTSPQAVPYTKQIQDYNKENAQNLITCPNPPNPDDVIDYFTANPNEYIAGDTCLASDAILKTNFTLETSVSWIPDTYYCGFFEESVCGLFSSTTSLSSIENLAIPNVTNIGYSGEDENKSSAVNTISDVYNGTFPIYGSDGAANQSGIWTWNVKFADLNQTNDQGCTYAGVVAISGPCEGIVPVEASVVVVVVEPYEYYPYFQVGLVQYNYTYSQSATLAIYNTKTLIPVSKAKDSSGNFTKYDGVSVVPFLNYNANTPVINTYVDGNTKTQVMNLPLDLYSPHNFLSGNYLDPYVFGTGTLLFASFKVPGGSCNDLHAVKFPSNVLSLEDPQPDGLDAGNDIGIITETLSQYEATTNIDPLVPYTICASNDNTRVRLGDYLIGGVGGNDDSIAVAPNDKIFVVSRPSHCGITFCFLQGSTNPDEGLSYLHIYRFFPNGTLDVIGTDPTNINILGNTTEFAYNTCVLSCPSTVPTTTDSQLLSQWNNIWETHWNNVSKEQSSTLYETNMYQVGETSSAASFYPGCPAKVNSPLCQTNFIPYAVQTDYADDIFLVGVNIKSISSNVTCGVSRNCKFSLDSEINGKVYYHKLTSLPDNFEATEDFASSPGGTYVYLATPNHGLIYVFRPSGTGSNVGTTINLTYNSIQYGGALDIGNYLENGGPYNDQALIDAYSSATCNPIVDSVGNHHPIGLQDYQGVLYVLDNWSFETTCDGQQVGGSILMLRAFGPDGTEIPIDPSSTYDIVLDSSLTRLVQLPAPPSGGYPPYGWPLSANISKPDGSFVDYCAADCLNTPVSIQIEQSDTVDDNGYPPIGPSIKLSLGTGKASGSAGKEFGFLMNYNGTAYLISKNDKYTEILAFGASVLNYTSIGINQYMPYVCYISTAPTGDSETPCFNPGDGSLTATQAANVADTYPPLLGIPSSFSYDTAQGYPAQYLTDLGSISDLAPTQGIVSNLQTEATTTIPATYAGTSPVSTPIIPTYENSTIGGFFAVPYKYTITTEQEWDYTGCDVIYADEGTEGFSCDPCTPGLLPPNPFDFCGQELNQAPAYQTNTTVTYKEGTVNARKNSTNQTIEGGSSYLYDPSKNEFYNASPTDQNLIVSPYIYYFLYTNRQIGELYLNQTIGPNIDPLTQENPLVMNAIRTLDYEEYDYNQVSIYGDAPSYAQQESIPLNPNIYGTDCESAGGSGCPVPYYYDPSESYNGNVILNYTGIGEPGIGPTIELFTAYKIATFEDQLATNLSNNTDIYGYNRLVYTFEDPFNNTIYAPIDVDIAHTVNVNFLPTVTVDPTNPGSSQISVSGSMMYCTDLLNTQCNQPVPAGTPVYIYYDTNLNYYNDTTAPTSATPGLAVDPDAYYEWAEQCAFSPTSAGCTLANPSYTEAWLPDLTAYYQNVTGVNEANTITYSPDYDPTTGLCPELTASIGSTPTINCNIYGNSYPATQNVDINGQTVEQYCSPLDSSGNGIFTSQMGLAAIAYTDQYGNFITSTPITACGTGTPIISAAYYGGPNPQPQIINQPPLSRSYLTPLAADPTTGLRPTPPPPSGTTPVATPAGLVATPVYGYTLAPSSSGVSTPIGSFVLKYGYVESIIAVGIVSGLILLLFLIASKRRK